MKDIVFGHHRLVLHPDGILIWPEEKIAVAADLHLEKASHFAQRGQFLPYQDSEETLEKLLAALEFCASNTLILLGDTFHDEQGFQRMGDKAASLFNRLCHIYDVLWIIGNHDGAFIPPKTKAEREWTHKGLSFRHEAVKSLPDADMFEISGHYHPKASIRLRGSRITRPCFAVSMQRMILPAFGALTGGLNVTDPAIDSLLDKGQSYHLLGQDRIYTIPASEKV